MAERSWAAAFLRTAGLRIAVLPVAAALTLTSAGFTMHFAGAAAFGFIVLVAQLRMALPFADLGLGAAVSRAVARAGESPAARREAAALPASAPRACWPWSASPAPCSLSRWGRQGCGRGSSECRSSCGGSSTPR
ncbi:hypothetical protein [Nesterenkonia sp. PF2B19]|uniref:hypothetical protein n=1 Tax=Nesterenkonia sp. PF2B19 TaxID=1881858 RepID=UPI00111BF0F9|nr:hypothetical protein [Nesterenkonia sp. PF2B19]